ncbi:MAG: CHAT domain-containing protein, partial [Candidatus Promineifilaceae bacterium]|nr:CHAT domain-containing protein [Candidatus Promineifilaceae bacterium]
EARGFRFRDGATSLDNLTAALDGVHIFHFLGHGEYDARAETASLYLEGERLRVDDATIAARVQGLDAPPRLIFLASCETASTGAAPFTGLARRLVRARVPAVVAMQELLDMTVARTLTAEFYRHLLPEGVVDRALNRARNMLFHSYRQNWDRDWAIPVLYMWLPEGRLLR